MTILTRLRRALCRHDWVPMYRVRGVLPDPDLNVSKCRKCGALWRVEPWVSPQDWPHERG